MKIKRNTLQKKLEYSTWKKEFIWFPRVINDTWIWLDYVESKRVYYDIEDLDEDANSGSKIYRLIHDED